MPAAATMITPSATAINFPGLAEGLSVMQFVDAPIRLHQTVVLGRRYDRQAVCRRASGPRSSTPNRVGSEVSRSTIIPYSASKGPVRKMMRGLCALMSA
jgi:hypothetical protein